MRRLAATLVLAVSFMIATPVLGAAPASASQAALPEKCEHGVKRALCTRCNPKRAPVFKAKGDWCGEHGLPESQCAKCNPKLAKEGVK